MNAKVKRLWLKALRSGKYEQGTGQLCSDVGGGRMLHCCLGVLEEIGVEQGVIARYPRYAGELDVEVATWAGLPARDPRLGPSKHSQLASQFNDSGMSFDFIADRVERYL